MKTISANSQLDDMENIACATGSTSYDYVREALYNDYVSLYGRGKFDLAPLTKKQERGFVTWLEDEDNG